MITQVIMRPVFNRPEMLKLSLEYEIKAREYFDIGHNFHTIFVVEHSSPSKTLELISKYPYSNSVLKRPYKFGLSANILEGLKTSFAFADDWLIYIEDDILLHETYFKYINEILNNKKLSNYSVISPYNFNDDGDVNTVRKDRHYAALGCLISKSFHQSYILPCSTNDFYKNPVNFSCRLNEQYREYWENRVYRYKDSTHHQQAGIINRLCDVARIEEKKYVVMPDINRVQHIGIYGANRIQRKELEGTTFEERVNFLREIIKDAAKMYNLAGSKQYNDYKIFSSKLATWDGTLKLADKHFTS